MEINKKELINYIDSLKKEVNVKLAVNDDLSGEKGNGLGTNQFRNLATLCKGCEAYEEIKLLIQYKIAKENPQKGWKCESIGEKILKYTDKINKTYENENLSLKALSLFFGYLYQSARVWKSEKMNKEGM